MKNEKVKEVKKIKEVKEVESIDEEALEKMRSLAPIVEAEPTCIAGNFDGTQCGKDTGVSEPGIDADLCPEHRDLMESQRRENAKIWSELNG